MGSQQTRPMATNNTQSNNTQSNITTNGNGLIGGGGEGRASTSRTDSLDRQDSIYSVSRDDYQRSFMEPGHGLTLGSMDIYEFMENIQGMASSMEKATCIEEGGSADNLGNVSSASENGGGGVVIRQPSLVNQPFLSRPRIRSFEELCRDRLETTSSLGPSGSVDGGEDVGNSRGPEVSDVARQTGQNALQVLFETAGIVACQQRQAQAQAHVHHQAQQQASEHLQEDWPRVQQQQVQAQQAHLQADLFQQATARAQQAPDQAQLFQGVGNGGPIPNILNGGYTGMASSSAQQFGQIGMQFALALPAPSPASEGGVNGHRNGLSLLSPVGTYGVDGSMGGRTRGADGPVDMAVVRRRQKLIKNRASAERSRVRKQARIVQLETEIAKLKEENERLKIEKEETAAKAAQLKEENRERLRKEWDEMAKSLVSESTVSQLQSDGQMKLRRTSSTPL